MPAIYLLLLLTKFNINHACAAYIFSLCIPYKNQSLVQCMNIKLRLSNNIPKFSKHLCRWLFWVVKVIEIAHETLFK